MAISLQNVINSRYSVGLAVGLGRMLPPAAGYRLADWAGGAIGGLRGTGIFQVVEANQWVVAGGGVCAGELARRTRKVFQNTARSLYDLYHALGRPEVVRKKVAFSAEFERCIERMCSGGKGTLLVCPHLSNFDLAGQAMAYRGLRILVLAYPQPSAGYRTQNKLRSVAGVESVPMSIESLRRATEMLQAGGTVLTGIDRPLVDVKYHPRFFSRPAALPVTHVRLALKLKIPITVVACRALADGGYQILASDPIPMQPHPDLVTETVRNAEAVLRVIEEWIQQTPEQWAMFYPVWPEAVGERQGEQ